MFSDSITLKCGTEISLVDLEKAGISYVPCGEVQGQDQPLLPYANVWGVRRHVTRATYGKSFNAWHLKEMTGVQIMTGYPTYRSDPTGSPDGFAYLVDLDIENHLLDTFGHHANRIIEIYREACEGSPCIVETKSGGRRLSAFAAYLDPKREFKDADGKMLMEFFSVKGLSRLDARYAMLEGSVLSIPTLTKSALQDIHAIISEVATEHQHEMKEARVVERSQLGALEIDWNADGKSQYFPAASCQATSHKNSTRETVRFQKWRGGVQGHCFNCGETWWELEPSERCRVAPVKLTIDGSFQRPVADIEAERTRISEALETWLTDTEEQTHQILNITTAAGTGKSTIAITTPEELLYIAKTSEEADQGFDLASQRELDAWRHRPRMFNRESEHWETLTLGLKSICRPCVYPERCNEIAARGHSPRVFCVHRCELFSECTEVGYLSQEKVEPNKQAVFYAWDEAFFSDRVHQGRVSRILGKEKLLVLDEGVPSNLPQQRSVSVTELAELAERHRYPNSPTYPFLKSLTEAVALATDARSFYRAVAQEVEALDVAEILLLDRELAAIPVTCVFFRREGTLEAELGYSDAHFDSRHVVVPVVSEKEQASGPCLCVDADEQIEIEVLTLRFFSLWGLQEIGLLDLSVGDIPFVKHHFVTELREFVEASHAKNPPCHKDGDGSWVYYLPPGLNADRGVILSASDAADHVSEVYRGTDIEVTTVSGDPPAWKAGCQLYQLATGRYTHKQGIVGDGCLRSQARRMVRLILRTADGGKKCLVVAQKGLRTLIEDDDVAALLAHEQIELINHHHAEGRNDFQDCDVVFVFHFEPSPEVIQSQASRVYRDAALCFDRAHGEITKDGVTLPRDRYLDDRVQAVYDRECQARLMQSVLRLRQHINENKIAVLFTAEPLAGLPMYPVPFTLEQAEKVSDWESLSECVRTDAEKSVVELAAQEGISESQAYRRTAASRQQTKAESADLLLTRILEMKEQEIGERKIATELGISYGKVRTLLKKQVH